MTTFDDRTPVARTHRILNLGAGVQSTVVALMVHRAELPPIECAIFADTQEEPAAVYRHLEWLTKEVSPSFPVWVRTVGRLGDGLIARAHRKGHTTIPAFTLNKKDGSTGIVRRQCTVDYKVDVVERTIRREVLGLAPRQRWPKGVTVEQLFGLSFEELGRMVRVKNAIQAKHSSRCAGSFPLIDLQMTRRTCLQWLKNYGVPHEVERSACVFCPYKSNKEWNRLKTTNPEGWARAVQIDDLIRNAHANGVHGMRNPQFLHNSCVPLDQIDFSTPEQRGDQGELGFVQECEGMCGN